MTTIAPGYPTALPAPTAMAAAFDPFADLKRELRDVVTDSANDVFTAQQPQIRRTIGDAIADQTPAIRTAVGGAIQDQLPLLRVQLDDFVADTQPQLQGMVDTTIERVKAELPAVIDAEVARQRAALQAEVQPILEQQTTNVKHVANSALAGGAIGGGLGVVGGFALGFRAWNGAPGGLLAAAGLGALGVATGALVGGWRGTSTLEA